MDGLPTHTLPDLSPLTRDCAVQRTLKAPIGCKGVGLHTGAPVAVRLTPAPADHGVVFIRTDLGIAIPARFDHVVDTRLCTVIGLGDARVGTIEHLMAALSAAGVDNAVIEVDGPELPILDGSSEPWLFLLDCAGMAEMHAPLRSIQLLRTVRVEAGDAFAELRPHWNGGQGLDLSMSIAFDAPAIGRQAFSLTLGALAFRRDLARARTFTQRHEIEGLQAAGLARGGSLDNAIVVDGARVLNPTGLRMADEFVRHKMLDAIGDLALAGAPILGRFIGNRSGHALNNRLLHAVFATQANWQPTAETLIAA